MPCLIRAHPLYVREGLEQALLRVKPLNVLIPLEHSSRLLAPRIKAVRDASSGRSSASLDPCSYVREGLEHKHWLPAVGWCLNPLVGRESLEHRAVSAHVLGVKS